MTRGMRKRWEKGSRTLIVGRDQRGREIIREGKNGGPVIDQTVVLVYVPKQARS